jgi:hypothetical protein
MSLKFATNVTRPGAQQKDKTQKRRGVMLTQVDEQIAFANGSKSPQGRAKPWWFETNGKVYIELRYGIRPLKPTADIPSAIVEVQGKGNKAILDTLRAVSEEINNGTFDASMEATMGGPRAPKGQGKAPRKPRAQPAVEENGGMAPIGTAPDATIEKDAEVG